MGIFGLVSVAKPIIVTVNSLRTRATTKKTSPHHTTTMDEEKQPIMLAPPYQDDAHDGLHTHRHCDHCGSPVFAELKPDSPRTHSVYDSRKLHLVFLGVVAAAFFGGAVVVSRAADRLYNELRAFEESGGLGDPILGAVPPWLEAPDEDFDSFFGEDFEAEGFYRESDQATRTAIEDDTAITTTTVTLITRTTTLNHRATARTLVQFLPALRPNRQPTTTAKNSPDAAVAPVVDSRKDEETRCPSRPFDLVVALAPSHNPISHHYKDTLAATQQPSSALARTTAAAVALALLLVCAAFAVSDQLREARASAAADAARAAVFRPYLVGLPGRGRRRRPPSRQRFGERFISAGKEGAVEGPARLLLGDDDERSGIIST
ncbi:hypothetical protein DFJ73DRAFT_798770 [Zopfochytrium polystomum]|nr:hypothetical protein DFJ73DRAFT_798770 [Zopfochytrium polystomum]